MRIRVLFFGQLKDIVGRHEDALDLEPGAILSAVVSHYGRHFPGFDSLAGSLACSINEEYAKASDLLHEGDEVALLPPVSGGKPAAPACHCAILHGPIPSQQIMAEVQAGEDGAKVVFEGIVRNHTRGRPTRYLDYEAYESMAIKELQRLGQAAVERFGVRDLRIVHRLGRLQIGETSVLIVVASAHRAAAFEACRWLIDSLKKTVPIWKKEYFEDGAVWADGEPFPEEIRNKQ